MRTFTYSDAKSHKFWNIELQGDAFTVTYGRVGATGQTQTKKFANAAKAQQEHDKLIKEKLAKGYTETTPSASKPSSEQEALEAALVENPDDLATHMAYADWLNEHGDPRGEFIQVQLALEDPKKSAAERKTLQNKEKALQKKHGREWLGELAGRLIDGDEGKKFPYRNPSYEYAFARGWLDNLEATYFTVDFCRTLARAPQARLLRRLVLKEPAYEEADTFAMGDDIPADFADRPTLFPLFRSRYLSNVRVLQLGEQIDETEVADYGFSCHDDGEAAVGLVKVMPNLEELYLLAHNVDADQLFGLKTLHNLRVLQLYHTHNYPLAKLVKNPSLGKLTHLLCHPHAMDFGAEPYIRLPAVRAVVRATNLPSLTHLRLRLSDMGDKGVAEIISSGILKRLKVLDLRHGCVTDAGAQALAKCPDARSLEMLDLDRNSLTEVGTKALEKAGIPFSARQQWEDEEEENSEGMGYLYQGDIE
jgi:uncharacterized protein (TIGR02996 family)